MDRGRCVGIDCGSFGVICGQSDEVLGKCLGCSEEMFLVFVKGGRWDGWGGGMDRVSTLSCNKEEAGLLHSGVGEEKLD